MCERGWTRNQINEMSLRDLRVYFMEDEDLKSTVRLLNPQSKGARQYLEQKLSRASENILKGLRWDFRSE